MPKSTFNNLPEEKQTKIEKLLIDVFSQKPASLVTVSDIIKQADFSRAAFYKYFEDIEDARNYINRRATDIAHEEIMHYIASSRNNFFRGIADYLVHVTELDREGLEYKMLKLIIESGNSIMYSLEEAMEKHESAMVKPWLKLLEINHIKITDPVESFSFLYFIMSLIMDSLSEYMVNDWSAEDLLKNYSFKVKWLENGIK